MRRALLLTVLFVVLPVLSSGQGRITSARTALPSLTLSGDLTFTNTTDQIKFPNLSGSAAVPSIAWANLSGVFDGGWFQAVTNNVSLSLLGIERIRISNAGILLRNNMAISWDSSGDPNAIALSLGFDADNILACRNGTNACEWRIYNTDSGSDDEFASLGWINNLDVFGIETEATGSGTVRDMAFLGGNVGFGTTSPNRAVDSAGVINAPSISASESYKSGLGAAIGSDTAHDIDVSAGAAQSFDTTHDVIFAAQAGKQIDVKWATGAAAGMLGVPDLTSAIVLTFSLTASPDTITAGSGTPWAACNGSTTETGTIIIQGGSTNDGTYEVASCTDTVLTLGEAVLAGDETGDSGEYESRYVDTNTWYHLFLIESAGAEDICADTSEIATNCLSESTYDQYRLLQSILTDGIANIRSF